MPGWGQSARQQLAGSTSRQIPDQRSTPLLLVPVWLNQIKPKGPVLQPAAYRQYVQANVLQKVNASADCASVAQWDQAKGSTEESQLEDNVLRTTSEQRSAPLLFVQVLLSHITPQKMLRSHSMLQYVFVFDYCSQYVVALELLAMSLFNKAMMQDGSVVELAAIIAITTHVSLCLHDQWCVIAKADCLQTMAVNIWVA